jgi:hypothetical protein
MPCPDHVGRPAGSPLRWATHAMGNPTQWATHAMGDAPRRPDANRHGRMGMACRGTACRAPTMLGDPPGRPYGGRRTQWATRAMGEARNGRRAASPRREPARQDGYGM